VRETLDLVWWDEEPREELADVVRLHLRDGNLPRVGRGGGGAPVGREDSMLPQAREELASARVKLVLRVKVERVELGYVRRDRVLGRDATRGVGERADRHGHDALAPERRKLHLLGHDRRSEVRVGEAAHKDVAPINDLPPPGAAVSTAYPGQVRRAKARTPSFAAAHEELCGVGAGPKRGAVKERRGMQDAAG
jgi:hypothetical protein